MSQRTHLVPNQSTTEHRPELEYYLTCRQSMPHTTSSHGNIYVLSWQWPIPSPAKILRTFLGQGHVWNMS